MKIAIVNGSMPHYDHGLGRVISVVASTLAELGLEIDEVNLGYTQIPYFDGMRAHVMDDIILRLRAASGVILASTAQQFAPNAMMQTFLEFFDCNEYRDALYEKHCLLALVSKLGGERSALEYLARTLCNLGAYESGRIGIQEIHARSITDGPDTAPNSIRDIVEKETEDFYRAIRQNRKYIMPMDISPTNGPVDFRLNNNVPMNSPVINNGHMNPQVINNVPINNTPINNVPINNIPINNTTINNNAPTNTPVMYQVPNTPQQGAYPPPPKNQSEQPEQSNQPDQPEINPDRLAPDRLATAAANAYNSSPKPNGNDINGTQAVTPSNSQAVDPSNSPSNNPGNNPAAKLNLDAFTERQEQDIKELTALFSQKYTQPQPNEGQYSDLPGSQPQAPYQMPNPQHHPLTGYQQPAPGNQGQGQGLGQFQMPAGYYQQSQHPNIQHPNIQQPNINNTHQTSFQQSAPQPQLKTIKQLTQNLPHYYQPQMAAGLTAVIQFSITGAETFEGYLTIIDNECDYADGQAGNPEITIISDSNTWQDVLKGKYTAQKAFMIGGLKVRGNFVLLTKFDTLFKL